MHNAALILNLFRHFPFGAFSKDNIYKQLMNKVVACLYAFRPFFKKKEEEEEEKVAQLVLKNKYVRIRGVWYLYKR